MTPDAVPPALPVCRPVPALQPVPLHHFPLGRSGRHRAIDQLCPGSAPDPLASAQTEQWTTDSPGWSQWASAAQEGNADYGRFSHSAGAEHLDIAMGGFDQPLRLDRSAGDRRVRADWFFRRLPQADAELASRA